MTAGGTPCIVVGYDGSEPARAAVTYAVKRAGSEGKVIIVNAYGPELPVAPDFQSALDDNKAHAGAVLDALMLEADNVLLDSDFELELVCGSPAEALTEVARAKQADEIVVGARGLGRVRAVLGSVSHDVLHRADRPVVVIPHNAVRDHSGAQE